MSNVSNELTKRFTQDKYPMSTGSDEWQDIKGDFEIEGDAVMGTVSKVDGNVQLENDKVVNFKSELEKFKTKLDNYQPKDELEVKEKEILSNKVKIGLEIYNTILS